MGQKPAGNKQNTRPEPETHAAPATKKVASTTPAKFSYEFSQPDFYVRHIIIEHDETGRGSITFDRRTDDTPYSERLEFSPVAMQRVAKLWHELNFVESNENYQSARQFPHLGTMKLHMEEGGRQRTAEFNWTNNPAVFALINEYRRAADQAILVFDLNVARENQPLNSPKLMDQLETMLKRNGLSDPQQLVPLLTDMSSDEHVPLMTRNHAARLLKQIEKL